MVHISCKTVAKVDILEELSSLIQRFETVTRGETESVWKVDGLRDIKHFLNITLSTFENYRKDEINRSYKVYSEEEKDGRNVEKKKRVYFLCLSPSFG